MSQNDVDRGAALLEVDRPRDAIPFLQRALAKDPLDYRGLVFLCRAKRWLGLLDEALDLANQAISVRPHQEWAHRLKALVLRDQGKVEEALEAVREARRLDPEEPLALQALTNLLIFAERWQEARESARALRVLEPNSEEAVVQLARVASELEEWQECEAYSQEVLEMAPNRISGLQLLGKAQYFQGRQAEGLEILLQAATLNPTHVGLRRDVERFARDFLFPPEQVQAIGESNRLAMLWRLSALLTQCQSRWKVLTPKVRSFLLAQIRLRQTWFLWLSLSLGAFAFIILWLYNVFHRHGFLDFSAGRDLTVIAVSLALVILGLLRAQTWRERRKSFL